jgi:hypothetical protein
MSMKVYLKQLLLTALVFCTLGFSSAWAFDEHVMESLDVESGMGLVDVMSVDSDGDMSHQQNEVDVACDHCCHISSHLVAIFSDAGSVSIVSISTHLSNLTENFHSFVVSPDRRPPRV